MLREIQLIGNTASISDAQFGAKEHRIVQHYIGLLEEYLEGGPAAADTPRPEA
jgi:hypothetical protein